MELIITIDGPPGSGKSTVARLLSDKLKMPLVSAGSIFRKMAEERKVSLEEFGKIAEGDGSIDRRLDERTLEVAARKESIILEGRLTGSMLHRNGIKAFKVLIDAPLDVRSHRVAGRDSASPAEAKKAIIKRQDSESARYRKLYGIEMKDIKIYDLVVESGDKTPEQIANIITEGFRKWQQAN
jgi:cytidylate kinase